MSETTAMSILVGRMKVVDLARLVGMGVEELVEAVVAPSSRRSTTASSSAPASTPAKPRTAAPAPALPRRAALRRSALPAVVEPPQLADMLDRASYGKIHDAVDRWFLGHVFGEAAGNISRAARRLRVSRKRVRVLWARLRDGRMDPTAGDDALAREPAPRTAHPPPDLEPLLPRGTYRQVHDAVDGWLLRHTLEQVDGNVSQAARQLAVSRKHLRDHLARVGLTGMARSRGG